MVGIIKKVKVGPKGQVVIPKIFRENLGIVEGNEVTFVIEGDRLTIKNQRESFVEVAERLSKGRICKLTPRDIKEMYAEQK